jgi:hypothetical protein
VSYLDVTTAGVRPLGSSLLSGTPATSLTPAGYVAYTYDVSDDGNSLLVGLAHGGTTTPEQDRTYGLVWVRRTAGVTTSQTISTLWDTAPALSADGLTAWFVRNGILWSNIGTGTFQVFGPDLRPHAGERLTGFSMSPDGSTVVAIYREDGVTVTTTTSRILAVNITLGKTVAYADISGNLQLYPQSPAWSSPTSFVLSYDDASTKNASVTLTTGGGTVDTTQSLGSPGLYDVQQLGTAWWGFRQNGTQTEYVTAPDLSTIAAAPATTYPLGAGTVWYRLSDVTPPAPVAPTPESFLTVTPNLILPLSHVLYRGRVPVDAWADYSMNREGVKAGDWVGQGTLQYSYDGVGWKNLFATSTGRRVSVVGWTGTWAGTTQQLTRNTWFRWVRPGDWFVPAVVSRRSLVRVQPTVKVAVAASGRYRTVAGSATRIGGIAVLYRGRLGLLRTVAKTTISSKGTYTFGRRVLAPGIYRVVVLKDANWNAGSLQFTVK